MSNSPALSVILNEVATPGTPQYSTWFHVGGRSVVGVSLKHEAGVSGAWSVQGAITTSDPGDSDAFDITLDDTIAAPAGTSGVTAVFLTPCEPEWIRIKFVGTSGDGIIQAVANAKVA